MRVVVVNQHGKWMGEFNVVCEAENRKKSLEEQFPSSKFKLEFWL